MSRPTFLPEVRQFSQADPHIEQRPEGLGGPGDQAVLTRDIRSGNVVKYAEMQASPGGWYEKELFTSNGINVGGTVMLLDDQLGFGANSVLVDNYSNQWIKIDGARRTIMPYSVGWVVNIPTGSQKATVRALAPSTNVPSPAALAGEYVWVGFSEAYLPASTGVMIPNNSGVLGANVDIFQVNGVAVKAAPVPGELTVFPYGGTDITAASGNVANAAAVAVLAAGGAGVTTYITGFEVTATGSTAALAVLLTVTGVISGTLTYVFLFPAGATTQAVPLSIEFSRPIPAAAANSAITVTLPAGGAGNLNATVVAHGFQL